MSTGTATQELPLKRRFEVRQCNNVKNMNYLVWDTKHEIPVCYHHLWVAAQASLEYYELHPPIDVKG